MQYVDTSALAKRYVKERDIKTARQLLAADAEWVTAAHTLVELRRTLSLRLQDDAAGLRRAVDAFEADWQAMYVVALDDDTCRRAAEIAETTGARTSDALHLGAAQRAGAPALRLVTFDVRMAQTARSLGWTVVGV